MIRIQLEDKTIEAELADRFLSRARGLSFRSEGKMLFAFDRDTRARIDMMLLSKPLHLYFLNSRKEVISAQKAEPWTLKPSSWKLYSPGQPYRYLLESFKDLDIEEGDKIGFEL